MHWLIVLFVNMYVYFEDSIWPRHHVNAIDSVVAKKGGPYSLIYLFQTTVYHLQIWDTLPELTFNIRKVTAQLED